MGLVACHLCLFTGGSGAKERLKCLDPKTKTRCGLNAMMEQIEPAVYKRWRRKAELMLLALPTTFEKSRWGPKLCEYISGEAEELIEHLSITDLCKDDGYVKVLEALDEKYQKRKQEEAQIYLKECFYKTVIKQAETYRQFIVRLETTYRHLLSHGIQLPDEVKGWFLLKKLCLDGTHEAFSINGKP